MSKSDNQRIRAKLYRSKSFRHELADSLGVGGMIGHIASCLDALLETRRLPSQGENNSSAAALDAALITIAVGTIQTNREALLFLTDSLSTIKLSKIVNIRGPAKHGISVAAGSDLVTDLKAAFVEYWSAPEGAFLDGLCHMAFITQVGGSSAGDAAILLRISDNREHLYLAVKPPAAEHERVRRTTRGGMTFMPSALANFADQLRNELDSTTAAVRNPHPFPWMSQS